MTVIFGFPDYKNITTSIALKINAIEGMLTVRHFPDGESYVKIGTDVKNQEVMVVCGLDNPDTKIMALIFLAETLRELGATKIGLVAPYLGYMRQDIRFHEGEAVTSNIFATVVSNYFDWLITLDPHLHRHKSLDEIYTLKGMVVHAADSIAKWIRDNITKPVLIGPDEESQQWVADIAHKAKAPFTILRKIRHGDTNVEVSVPEVEKYQNHTPVLVDDIISTARTMIETVKHLHDKGMQSSVCIGIHAIFAPGAYENLLKAGVKQVITCNTVIHPSNGIDIGHVISNAIYTGMTIPT